MEPSDFSKFEPDPEAIHQELVGYLVQSQQALQRIDAEAVARFTHRVIRTWHEDRQLLVFGNGGSAATATHLAEDLATYAIPFSEPKRLRVLCLNDSPSIITALGNDLDFDSIFLEQVQQWARPGDLVLTMSGSGNSSNLIAAMRRAEQLGCETAAMTGFDGGELRGLVDHPLHVEVHQMQPAQDAQMVMTHMIIHGFRVAIRNYLAQRTSGSSGS
ncbi:MAG: SIS domain-containing protein [Planctomycetota bacterium]|nr:SIS domain-containing protein [Planctomycetota bacterium]